MNNQTQMFLSSATRQLLHHIIALTVWAVKAHILHQRRLSGTKQTPLLALLIGNQSTWAEKPFTTTCVYLMTHQLRAPIIMRKSSPLPLKLAQTVQTVYSQCAPSRQTTLLSCTTFKLVRWFQTFLLQFKPIVIPPRATFNTDISMRKPAQT